MTAEEKIKELGIELPGPLEASPLAEHLWIKRSKDLLVLGGICPLRGSLPAVRGKVVRDMLHEDAYGAARLCALNALSLIKKELGSLDLVEDVISVTGYVAGDDDFYDQHMIMNGASHLLVDIFGEKGKHVCSPVGVNSLPFDSPVMIDMTVRIKDDIEKRRIAL